MQKRKPGNTELYTAPIASATKGKHLQTFTEATRVELSEADMNQLNEASAFTK